MSDRTLREPKDLGIKVGTKVEAFWEGIKSNCEEQIIQMGQGLKIVESNLKLAKDRILLEKRK